MGLFEVFQYHGPNIKEGEQFLLLRLLPSSFDRIVTGRSNNSNAAQNQEPHFNWPALIMGTRRTTQAIQA